MPEDLVMKLWAMEQIRQLKARYFRAIDTGSRAAVALFHRRRNRRLPRREHRLRTGVDAVPICSEESLQQ